jgi:altronate dehydratase small subunit
MLSKNAIGIDEKDNVATAIQDLPCNSKAYVEVLGKSVCIKVRQFIHFGHKFALTRIHKNGEVIKYGEVIGIASKKIEPGEHVHTHNVRSIRGG